MTSEDPAIEYVRVECPSCQQHIESPHGMRFVKCPTCGEVFEVKAIVAPRAKSHLGLASWIVGACLAGSLVYWVVISQVRDVDSAIQDTSWGDGAYEPGKLSAAAKVALREACSNAIPGVIRVSGYVPSDGPVNTWRTEATVDYLNERGGVSRTNLPMRYKMTFGSVYAVVDTDEVLARRSRGY